MTNPPPAARFSTAMSPAVMSLVGQPESRRPAPPSPSPGSPTAAEPPQKLSFPLPAEEPTQAGPQGLRYDFNHGCRVALPERTGNWRVRLPTSTHPISCMKQRSARVSWRAQSDYFLRIRIEYAITDGVILAHDYDARDREVLIQFPVGTLGDIMGWFPYAVKFQARMAAASASRMAAG